MKRFIFSILTFLVCLAPAAQAQPSLDEMIGQMLLVGFRGYDLDMDNPVLQDVKALNVGGVILFNYDVMQGRPQRNIQSPAQVRKLIAGIKSLTASPLLVSVDQEGGRVQRLRKENGFMETPSAAELGASYDPSRSLWAGRIVGMVAAEAGFNLDFAPCVDVNVNPESPAIGALGRSFSSSPRLVAACAREFINGLHEQGMLSCIKHFPGHGSARVDSHLGVTDVTRTWQQRELIPYERLIATHKPDAIMTAHIFNARLDPKYPATLSSATINGLLRRKLGWDGVVITDDMNMKAISSQYGLDKSIRLAILAGADMLLFGNNLSYDPLIARKAHGIIKKLVEDGKITRARISESHARIMKMKKKLD
ncbi:beta-N-acetylhexosaminidase [Salidesulfovibrio onnuriiensis]|uniref:beta-N-acetylhexosaminidase n=1 Tax=Salidesulfovibrio onnuriiensis TaxID=2583823 RepID=UPI0011CA65EC|nr:beta-N-acetylhexosaminidase [Salidesulfovibrio onnuriiensis]